MDPVFYNAVLAQKARTVCLGVRLQPLTVGHLFVLLEQRNAYPEHGETAKPEDLITAVLVCSQKSHKLARRMIKSRFARIGIKIWGALNAQEFCTGLGKAEATFNRYLREQLAIPQGDEMRRGGELRAPIAWRLISMLMADFHRTQEEALETSVAFALTIWATEADRRGTCKLASERQVQFRAWAAEMERERLSREQGAGSKEQGAQSAEQGGNAS